MGFSTERTNLVYTARIAHEAERYDEMVEAMKKVTDLDVELTVEERTLLTVGYKKVVDARRSSWRILSSKEQEEEANGSNSDKFYVEQLKKYRQKVESEISTTCGDIITVVDGLIPFALDGESTASYHKMKGDYYRYLAEIKAGDEKQEAAENSKKAYEKATAVAKAELHPANCTRLGMALNFSVLYKDILNNPDTGFGIAKIAVDEGLAGFRDASFSDTDEQFKNCVTIMIQLKDNFHPVYDFSSTSSNMYASNSGGIMQN